jgi:hypothetical protein
MNNIRQAERGDEIFRILKVEKITCDMRRSRQRKFVDEGSSLMEQAAGWNELVCRASR